MDQHNILAERENIKGPAGKRLSLGAIDGEDFPRLLLDNLEAAIYTCNAEGYITFYNKAAASLWGREPDIGVDLWCGSWKIFEPDGRTPLPLEACPMAITLKEGRPVNGHEIVIQKPNGEMRHVVPYPRPFLDEKGRVTGAINLLVDVSSYKRSEQREAHLAAIVDSSDDAIVSKTLDGIVTSWNLAAEKIFGYTAAEMIGQPLLKIIPTDRWPEEHYIQEQMRAGRRIDHFETKRISKGGRMLEVSLTISPILDRQGNIIGASKIARDITRQKEDARALQESEERYKLAVETAKLGTWALNPETGNFSCSTECRAILGIQDNDCLTLDAFLLQVPPPDTDRVLQYLAWAGDPASGKEYDFEHRIVRKNDKTIRWVRVKGKMYFNPEGRPGKLFGTMLDITDEKMAKEALERTVAERTLDLQITNQRLRRSNHDLEQFAYIASHDLQEPLRKIQTYIDMIGKAGNKGLADIYYSKITRSANRMSTLIREVLNYSRLDMRDAVFKEVNLDQLFKEVTADYESLIREKAAVITTNGLPVVAGIDTQLRQLFANLLGNALKFSASNCRIDIAADLPAAGEYWRYPGLDVEKRYWRLIFSDNGIGFEQQYADKIFMIFQRLHSASEYSGTGIGLALCKKIVENHHGYIRADSRPGTGAVFTVLLPA